MEKMSGKVLSPDCSNRQLNSSLAPGIFYALLSSADFFFQTQIEKNKQGISSEFQCLDPDQAGHFLA